MAVYVLHWISFDLVKDILSLCLDDYKGSVQGISTYFLPLEMKTVFFHK